MQTYSQATGSIGSAVRARRRQLQLRQVDLADLAGCSARFVHSLEHDKPTLLLDKVVAVLEVLGLQLAVVPLNPTAAS
jgi:y4mF family transcriptional regulator